MSAAGGCKSDEGALNGFGAEAARVVCDKAYECCAEMELVGHMDYKGGRAACGSKSEKSLGFWAAVISQEQDKGRLSYDEAVSRRCLAAFAAASCEAHKGNEPLDGCDSFITPKTSPGQPCNANESCIGGACMGVMEGKEGVCRAFVGLGESCADAPCAKGTHCNPGNKLCDPDRANGTMCQLNNECQSGGCNGRMPDGGAPGTCGLKGGENTRCFVTTGCAYGGDGPQSPGVLVIVALLGLMGTMLLGRGRGRRETKQERRST
jgi:hypothetical protein